LITSEKEAVRHYRCDHCGRQLYPGEPVIYVHDPSFKNFDIVCRDCYKEVYEPKIAK